MDENVLEDIYQERIDERLIGYLSENFGMDYNKAMDVYYRSELAEKIHAGKYGVQYLDYKVLGEILVKTEPELLYSKGNNVE